MAKHYQTEVTYLTCLACSPIQHVLRVIKRSRHPILDVFHTNRPKKFYTSTSMETDISDFHHIIVTVMKGSNQKPLQKYHTCTSHSYRKSDETKFVRDINDALVAVDVTLSDCEKYRSTLSIIIKNVTDHQAPIKTRKIRNHSSPAMNG